MKRFWRDNRSMVDSRWSVAKLWTILLLVTLSCSQNKKEAATEKYTCPMHPEIVQDKPGTCPICFMDLVQKNRKGQDVEVTAELNYLLKPTNASVISSIQTVIPLRESVKTTERVNGAISYDTRNSAVISSRVAGRIEKLYVKYRLQPIRRGQKVLEIYSPELITAQRDLIFLLGTDPDNARLITSAKEKLSLLGATEQQISQIVELKKEMNLFSVVSAVDGYAIEDAEKDQSELSVREGMYLSVGQTIVKVINTHQVWAEFDIPQTKISTIKLSDPIRIAIEGKKSIDSKISFAQPFFKGEEKFTKVRAYLSNPDNSYKIGQLIEGLLDQQREGLWIPASARIVLGTKEIVFVKMSGMFRPRLITTSHNFEGKLEVIQGLTESDSVAYDARFLVDSESFIKVNE